jgi:putative hydrolase of the HAD superfamily
VQRPFAAAGGRRRRGARRFHRRQWAQRLFTGWAGDWGEFDRGRLDAAALVQRTSRRTGMPAADVQAVVQAIPRALQPDAETVGLVKRLRQRGHRLLFLSNMPEPYACHLERHHAIGDWFDDGLYSARVDAIKPEPRIFELATLRFGGDARQIVFLDDMVVNVMAAQDAGWQALRFVDALQAEQALSALGVG